MDAKAESKYDDDDGGGAKSSGGRGAKAEAKGDAGLIKKVYEFYNESPELEDDVRRFVFRHCGAFEPEARRPGETLAS